MKVLLIGFTKIAYMPYIHFYINQLHKTNSEIILIYWDRDGKPDVEPPRGVNVLKFFDNMSDSESMAKKMPHFMRFRKYVKNVIKENDFDLILVLHSTPGVLLYDILTKKYSRKYILDYRDVTYENFKLYKKIIHGLVDHSIATFVSSDAFRAHLPTKNNIYTSHNVLLDSLKNRDIRRYLPRDNQPIRIRYWGFIRHEEINKRIITRLANDSRFELHYHGREQKTAYILKQYCKELGINNVFFHGEYKPDDRYEFAKETDILHNLFENDKVMKPATANKFYDGIVFYIPQLCNEGSFMGQKVETAGIGIALDPNKENFADLVFEYYNSLNWEDFNVMCDDTLKKVVAEYSEGTEIIQDILNGKRIQ
jgi:hypothetical protein